MKPAHSVLWLLASAGPLAASIVQYNNLNLPITGADDGGTAVFRTVSGISGPITSLEVSLVIAGNPFGANGDLFVMLSNDSLTAPYSVLMNRVGRTTSAPTGYGDSGLSVTFADNAVNGDIHQYRLTLTGSAGTPVSNLSGRWAPSGRETDPDSVLDSSARTAPLGNFSGTNPNATWTLYLVDMVEGGNSRLMSWSMDFAPVPEPESVAVVGLGLVGLWAIGRKLGRS
jgi:hypothetical protein